VNYYSSYAPSGTVYFINPSGLSISAPSVPGNGQACGWISFQLDFPLSLWVRVGVRAKFAWVEISGCKMSRR
jgi:hypothetical protein